MDDIGKAIIMIGQVLLFTTALSISVFLYNSLTERTESIMITNTNNNRGDAIINIETIEKREVSGAEVALAILDLKEQSGDYLVKVDGTTYTYNPDKNTINERDYDSSNLRLMLMPIASGTYEMTDYSLDKTLVYKRK